MILDKRKHTLAAYLAASVILTTMLLQIWGDRSFGTCEFTPRLFNWYDCRHFASFKSQAALDVAEAPNGDVVLLLGQAGSQDVPQRVQAVRFDPVTREQDVPIVLDLWDDLPVLSTAIDPNGSRVVVSVLDGGTRVLDLATGDRVRADLPMTALRLGFTDATRLVAQTTMLDPETGEEQPTLVMDVRTGAWDFVADGSDLVALGASGVGQAATPDGRLTLRHVPTSADSGVVRLQVVEDGAPVRELEVPLAYGGVSEVGHMPPWIWISPDASHVAASFYSPPRFGRDTSALVVWDIVSGAVVARVSSKRHPWQNVIWRPDGAHLIATRRYENKGIYTQLMQIRYRR